jgi:putative membrane protein
MPLFAMWDWNAFGFALLAAAVFGLLGIGLLLAGFKLFERLTPKLDVEQKLQEGSVAVAIVVGALLIAIGMVVSAAIHG